MLIYCILGQFSFRTFANYDNVGAAAEIVAQYEDLMLTPLVTVKRRIIRCEQILCVFFGFLLLLFETPNLVA